MQVLQEQRVSRFIAKLQLRQYQRVLVTLFSQYRIEKLEKQSKDDNNQGQQAQTKMSGQRDEQEAKLPLKVAIREMFDPFDSQADLAILFETLQVKNKSQSEADFWSYYCDQDELQWWINLDQGGSAEDKE